MSEDGKRPERDKKPRSAGGSRPSGNSRGSGERTSKSRPTENSRESGEKKPSFGAGSRSSAGNRPTAGGARKPKTTRGGDRFDSRDKYENGDKKPFNKKPSNKKPYIRPETAEDKTKSFIQKRRFEKISKEVYKDTIRLNKYIANSGICSRREADELIAQGLVEVNGTVVTEMGYQVQKTDRVVFDSQNITPEKPVYVLLNKPKGYISTTKDEKARKTVMDLTANASPYRIFPVGRLDRQTTGVILLTNDGHITKKLTHPSFAMRKIYHVTLDRKLTNDDMKLIGEGIRLEEGVAEVDSISFIEGKPKNEVGIEIHIGWNRVVRRIFQKLGYEVEALDRVMFAGLTKKNIKRGHWRILSELEVNNLKML
ncbi:Ribosomal large subunit pseudouridine synthase B [compost metagenome]